MSSKARADSNPQLTELLLLVSLAAGFLFLSGGPYERMD